MFTLPPAGGCGYCATNSASAARRMAESKLSKVRISGVFFMVFLTAFSLQPSVYASCWMRLVHFDHGFDHAVAIVRHEFKCIRGSLEGKAVRQHKVRAQFS